MTDQQAPELKTETSFNIYFNESHKIEQIGYEPTTKKEWATLSSVQAREAFYKNKIYILEKKYKEAFKYWGKALKRIKELEKERDFWKRGFENR